MEQKSLSHNQLLFFGWVDMKLNEVLNERRYWQYTQSTALRTLSTTLVRETGDQEEYYGQFLIHSQICLHEESKNWILSLLRDAEDEHYFGSWKINRNKSPFTVRLEPKRDNSIVYKPFSCLSISLLKFYFFIKFFYVWKYFLQRILSRMVIESVYWIFNVNWSYSLERSIKGQFFP